MSAGAFPVFSQGVPDPCMEKVKHLLFKPVGPVDSKNVVSLAITDNAFNKTLEVSVFLASGAELQYAYHHSVLEGCTPSPEYALKDFDFTGAKAGPLSIHYLPKQGHSAIGTLFKKAEIPKVVEWDSGHGKISVKDLASMALSHAPQPAHKVYYTKSYFLTYSCALCGQQDRVYNARDGLVSNYFVCHGCVEGAQKLQPGSVFAPDHVPVPGQRMWVDMTVLRAQALALRQLLYSSKFEHLTPTTAMQDPEFIKDFQGRWTTLYGDGHSPDLIIQGYVEAM